MKTIWSIDGNQARMELVPETMMDRALLDGLGNITSATVKKNGTFVFLMELPSQAVAKPTLPRGADEVRDTGSGD